MTHRPFVDYLVARERLPAPSGAAYDYLLAGDGLFLAAENLDLAVRVPVCEAAVRGLPPLGSRLLLLHGRVPGSLWDVMALLARQAAEAHREILFAVAHDEQGYRLLLPPQLTGATSVRFVRPERVLLEVHSHGHGHAFFSPTDTADEQRLRLYGVIGRVQAARPEMSLRVGAYGHFQMVRWDDVFDGDPAGVRDLGVEQSEESDLRERRAWYVVPR